MPAGGMKQAPLEKEQGAVQAEEQLAAGAPGPQGQDIEMQAAQMGAEAAMPEEQPTEQAAPMQQGYTVKNPYMLMPQGANYGRLQGPGAQRPKTPSEIDYDAGIVFDVMATNNPIFRMMRDELMRGKK